MNKRYLGDGVYIEIAEDMVKLTTEDGIQTTNVIYLEYETLNNLKTYLTEIGVK